MPAVQRTGTGQSARASRAVGMSPGSSLAPIRMTRAEARKRRRDVLFTLAAAATLTFPLAVIMGGPVWGLQLVCDLMLAAYIVMLVQAQQRAAEQDAKVRYLPGRQRAPEPALLLRRSGS
jgi:hypothetical protein